MTLDEFYKQTNKITTCFNELGFTGKYKPIINIEIRTSLDYKQYRKDWVVRDANNFAEFADYVNEDLYFDSDNIKDNIKKFIIETLKTYDFSFTKDCYDDECKIYSENIIRYDDSIIIKLNIFYMLA